MVISNKSIAYLLVFAICGNLTYFIFPFPAMVWRLIILSCCILTFLTCRNIKHTPGKYIGIFLTINLLYFLYRYFEMDIEFTTIGNTFVALMPFIALTRLGSVPNVLTSKWLTVSAILLTLCSISYFEYSRSFLLLNMSAESFYGDYVTLNASVVFLMLLPLCILLKNKILSLSIVCVCIYFLVSSVKRGNILASIIPLAIFVYELWKSTSKKFFKRALLIIALVFISSLVIDLIVNNEYFQFRIQQTQRGDSSHRGVIYQTMWNLWYAKADLLQLIFGYGYYGTVLYSGGYMAHNDWLEVLVDFGLIGCISYLAIFISMIKSTWHIDNKLYRNVLWAIIAVWLFKTAYSMGFTDEYLSIMALPYGYIMGNKYSKQQL